MNDKSQLYKLTFSSTSNHSLLPRIEYLRCESKEMLEKAINQAMRIPQSQYYGFKKVEIEKVKSFPEIISVEIDLDVIISKKYPQIKKHEKNYNCCDVDPNHLIRFMITPQQTTLIKELENKITYHTKSIRKAKDKIHNIRGDDNNDKKCTLPLANSGCEGTCPNHYKCKKCNKIHLTKRGLQTKKNEEAKIKK